MDSIRVLLVDDSAIFLRRAAEFLEEYEDLLVVGAARSGREALDQVLPLQPDIILLDLHMPGLSGLEVLPQLRALLPTVGIIVLSLFELEVYRRAALAAGADDYVAKGEMSTALLPAIKRVARISRPIQAPTDS
ncbi:MAG: response regulator transcription factor [Anaerolineales bacterium]|nr:response regulator transcription factor [Anaerolineales bacterium]